MRVWQARCAALAGAAVWLLALGAAAAEGGVPSISVDVVPPYGSLGLLSGTVGGVDFSRHRVAVYIQIEGWGWWSKPTFASPTVAIGPSGAFSADVGTGGPGSLDGRATILCAALLPDTAAAPIAAGAGRIPASLAPLALDCRERYARTFEFAGYRWAVKESPLPVGPGLNVFSDHDEDVFVDAEGLHLRVAFRDGQWWASEVILLTALGHGIYTVQTASELDDLDAHVTFGFFTWDAYGDEETAPGNPSREIDFEDSRWGDPFDPTNAQMVVQPFDAPGHLRRYTLPDLAADPALTRFFRWWPDAIHFVALRGHRSPTHFDALDVIDEYVYAHDPPTRYVPTPGRARTRMNLWLHDVEPGGGGPPEPAGGAPVEVVITDFSYLPEPSRELLLAAAGAALGLLAARRRARQGVGARYSTSSSAARSGVPS